MRWHQFRVMYVTDGTATVWCIFCRKRRQPTAEELADHPNASMTAEEQAALNAKIEQMNAWLDEHWDKID